MKKILILLSLMSVLVIACTTKKSDTALAEAAALTDSIARAEADGNAQACPPDIQLSFNVADTNIYLGAVGEDLFDVFAAQQLKRISPRDISAVCNALRESGGQLNVVINSPSGESVDFNLTPQKIIKLQRAKNSEFNLAGARSQVVAVAEKMIPAPEAHAGAVRVDVSVSKSFLEYNIVWAKSSSYDRYTQGLLTKNYFNPLKRMYQELGTLAEPAVELLKSLGIDGVRIVYSAENSDKQLRQAFPWREISEPIEE